MIYCLGNGPRQMPKPDPRVRNGRLRKQGDGDMGNRNRVFGPPRDAFGVRSCKKPTCVIPGAYRHQQVALHERAQRIVLAQARIRWKSPCFCAAFRINAVKPLGAGEK